MSSPVVTIDAEADLRDAFGIFHEHAIRRLAVTEAGRFAGVISIDDLLVDVGGCLSLGVVHSALLGVITGGLLLPAAIALEGATSLPIPTLPVPGINAGFEFGAIIAVAHLIYGLVLGRVFAALTLAEGAIGWLPFDPVDR
jgi:CBS domain-containing protein